MKYGPMAAARRPKKFVEPGVNFASREKTYFPPGSAVTLCRVRVRPSFSVNRC
jgi:hypothetical protein